MTTVRRAKLHNPQLLRVLVADRGAATRLANGCGISRQFVSQLTTSKVDSCTPALAAQIAKTLGVSIDTLFAPVALRSTTRHHSNKQKATQ